MAGEHLTKHARRVVSGVNDSGKSTIVEDGDTPTRLATEAFTINQIWQVDSLPLHVLAEDTSTAELSTTPPGSGFIYLVTTIPPDSDYDMAAGYAAALAASGPAGTPGADTDTDGTIVGLHQTDTLDIITVLNGELHALMEDGEVSLKPGDSFVQRGTQHAWSNRADQPCTIVAVMMSAFR